jgi:L-malate glycosyltransferase
MVKPRILIIENSIATTGALKSIIRSSQGLAHDYSFVFLLPEKSTGIHYVRSLGFEVYEFPMKELNKKITALLAYPAALLYNSVKLKQLVHNLGINLIVVNDFYNLLPATYKIFGGSLPYVCYVRFLPSKFPTQLIKFWCAWHHRYASHTIAVSEIVKEQLPYEKNVIVIGNELPAEEVPFTSSDNSTTILYPANYIQGKGHEFALEAFSLISKKYPQWKLKFVGGDMGLKKNQDFKQGLVAMASRLKLESQVEWHSFAENISREYLNAAIVLNFSESESFSLTCLEAMFYGRPVIATRSGGPAEIIDHDASGILVDLKDITAMAKAMDELISNPEKREQMSRFAYERVRQKFSYQNTIGKLGEVYKAAIKDY